MKRLAFSRWPVIGRIGNPFVRRLSGSLILTIAVCVVWFIANRALAPLNAVRIETVQIEPAETAPFDGCLRVVTYNIAHGRGLADNNCQIGDRQTHLNRLDEIAALLRDSQADIVVLNEVDFDAVWTSSVDQAVHIAEKAGFEFVVEQRNFDMAIPFAGLRWGNAILSKYPVSNPQCIDFAAYSNWEPIVAGHKKGVLCEIQLSDKSMVRVLGVHLDTRSEATRVQAAEQIEEIRLESKVPLIVAGDMNTAPPGFPDVKPTPDGQTAMSFLLAAGGYRTSPAKSPRPSDFTFPSPDPRRTIDWILIPREWELISRQVLPGMLSDHKAVLIEAYAESLAGESGAHDSVGVQSDKPSKISKIHLVLLAGLAASIVLLARARRKMMAN